jgi:hypothetical protein
MGFELTNAEVDQPEEKGPVDDGGGEEGDVVLEPRQQAHPVCMRSMPMIFHTTHPPPPRLVTECLLFRF